MRKNMGMCWCKFVLTAPTNFVYEACYSIYDEGICCTIFVLLILVTITKLLKHAQYLDDRSHLLDLNQGSSV